MVEVEQLPTIAVDQLHLTYRVWGGKRVRDEGATQSAGGVLTQRLRRGRSRTGLREVRALRGVSFTAYRGDAIGLVGRNGSGKSTLLRVISGVLPATHGAVYTSAQPALLGVNAALMDALTGEQNIVLGCLAMGMTPAEVDRRFDSIVEFSGLGDFINLPMTAYSSGMSARLKFAIAASVTHEILLIDEALATGDADFRKRSEDRIRELREQAGTVFLVSHALDVVRETCNRTIWLEMGEVVEDGPTETVLEHYETFVKEMTKNYRAEMRERRESIGRAMRAATDAAPTPLGAEGSPAGDPTGPAAARPGG